MTRMDKDGQTRKLGVGNPFARLAAYTATAVPIRLRRRPTYKATRSDGFRPRQPWLGKELRTIRTEPPTGDPSTPYTVTT